MELRSLFFALSSTDFLSPSSRELNTEATMYVIRANPDLSREMIAEYDGLRGWIVRRESETDSSVLIFVPFGSNQLLEDDDIVREDEARIRTTERPSSPSHIQRNPDDPYNGQTLNPTDVGRPYASEVPSLFSVF